jgi:hypothetical protein
MIQGRLDLGGEPLTFAYTIDTSSLMWLDGMNDSDGSTRYSPDEREAVWAGLDGLALRGRLKTITQVRHELQRLHPEALEHLGRHGRLTYAPRVTNTVRTLYRLITAQFPGVVRPDWARDPADPWLVAFAEVYGYSVITDELLAIHHASRYKRSKIHLPDICDGRTPKVPWLSLRSLAVQQGWIVDQRV